jgi:6-pyruvoyl-tetrahydropterin synthase
MENISDVDSAKTEFTEEQDKREDISTELPVTKEEPTDENITKDVIADVIPLSNQEQVSVSDNPTRE